MSARGSNIGNQVVANALSSLGEIATLPEVAVKIIEVTEDPSGDAAALHEVIRRDPALSAKVLKVVNSSFYGLPGQIASLERAIVMLGTRAIKNIAVGASLAHTFTNSRAANRTLALALWKHSLAVAIAARELNAARTGAVGDEICLAGLIHDIGLLAELQAFPEKLDQVVQRCGASEGDFLELEEAIIGATHPEFAAALTASWRFPRRLCAVVSSHHEPEALPEEFRPAGSLLRCADLLCCQEGLGFDLTQSGRKLTRELLDEIGVDDERLSEIRGGLETQIAEAEAVLGSKC